MRYWRNIAHMNAYNSAHKNAHKKKRKMEDTLLAVTNLMTVMNIAPDKNRQGGHRPGWCQAWG